MTEAELSGFVRSGGGIDALSGGIRDPDQYLFTTGDILYEQSSNEMTMPYAKGGES